MYPLLKIDGCSCTRYYDGPAVPLRLRILLLSKISYTPIFLSRAVVVAGAEGAAAPVNFEQRVHAPVNFQPF